VNIIEPINTPNIAPQEKLNGVVVIIIGVDSVMTIIIKKAALKDDKSSSMYFIKICDYFIKSKSVKKNVYPTKTKSKTAMHNPNFILQKFKIFKLINLRNIF
jgi:hypothetical protein